MGLRKYVALVALMFLSISCGQALQDLGDENDRTSRKSLAQGFTPCGDFMAPRGQSNTCHPNQYCVDPTFSTCRLGCLSEYNCTENQFCQKSNSSDVGTCVDTSGNQFDDLLGW